MVYDLDYLFLNQEKQYLNMVYDLELIKTNTHYIQTN